MKFMIKNIFKKNYVISSFVIYMLFLATIASRWIADLVYIPPIVSMGITVLQYLPFAAFGLLKFIKDIQQKKIDFFNVAYYSFILYYLLITIYRFFSGGVIKENLYITIILVGSLAFISLISESRYDFVSNKLSKNITIISLALILYRLIFVLFVRKTLIYSPINEIALGSMIMLLIPVNVKLLADNKGNRKAQILQTLNLFSFIAIIFTLSSRVMFLVSVVELIIVFIVLIINKNKQVLIKTIVATLCAVLLIAGLFAMNVGGVRFAVYRELGVVYVPTNPNEENEEAEQAQEQIQRSDAMRGALFNASLEEIKKNPIFSTGKTFFQYTTSGGEEFNVPAHNFVLTALNCYGIVGFGIIIAMFIALLLKHKLFCFKQENSFINLLVWSVIIIFFGIGMVQASVFDILVMPMFCIAMGGLINQRENKA